MRSWFVQTEDALLPAGLGWKRAPTASPWAKRRLAADIPAADLAALRSTDPAFVRRLAFDLAALRRKTSSIVQPDGLEVEKAIALVVPHAGSSPWRTRGGSSSETDARVEVAASRRPDRYRGKISV